MSSAFLFAAKSAQALAKFSAFDFSTPGKAAFAPDDFLDRWRYEIANGTPVAQLCF